MRDEKYKVIVEEFTEGESVASPYYSRIYEQIVDTIDVVAIVDEVNNGPARRAKKVTMITSTAGPPSWRPHCEYEKNNNYNKGRNEMNKTTIEYVRNRVSEVVKCTNGAISTKMNKKKKGTGLTFAAKIRQIRSGKAELIGDIELGGYESGYHNSAEKELNRLFKFKTTDKQKEKIQYNKNIDTAIEEMHTTVELAGKALIDKVVLEIIPVKDMPAALEDLARTFEISKL